MVELEPQPIQAQYANWKGSLRERNLLPKRIWYGTTEWHTVPQWLLRAVDLDDGREKDFAMSGFLAWPEPL